LGEFDFLLINLFRDLLPLDPERLGLSFLDLFLRISLRDLDLPLFKEVPSFLPSFLLETDLSFLEVGRPLFRSLLSTDISL